MKQSSLEPFFGSFNGSDYKPELDEERLTGQICRIFNLMKDAQWRTLNEIQKETGDPQASISAQLRHLRKKRFGGHVVNKRRVEGKEKQGLFEYQLIINPDCEIIFENGDANENTKI